MNNEVRFFAKTIQNRKTIYSALILCITLLLIILMNMLPMLIEYFFAEFSFTNSLIKAGLAFVLAMLCLYSFSALSLGSKRYFLRCCTGENKKIANLFYFFKPSNFVKTICFLFCSYFVNFVCIAVSLLPSAVMLFLWIRMITNDVSLRVAVIFLACFLMMLILSVYFLFRTKRLFFLCSYLFVADESRKFSDCLRISMKKMEHETKRLFFIRFGFIGWIASCVFILPIIYVWSYYKQTMAVFAEKLMKSNQCDLDTI